MAVARRKIEVAEDMFVWTEQCYTMHEIGRKFGENYPPYMCLEQGDFRLEPWQCVDPGEVLRIHSQIIQTRLEAKFVYPNGKFSQPFDIPAQCSLKVKVLPPRKNDPEHVYKSVAELVRDFPPQAQVLKTSGRNAHLNVGDVLSLKALETVKHFTGSSQVLVGKIGTLDVRLPLNCKADFVFHSDGRSYTPYEVLNNFPAPQRVQFFQGIPTHHMSQELLREYQNARSPDEVMLLRIYKQMLYVCTFEPVDIKETNHISYRDEVIFLPGDERGDTTFVVLPVGIVPIQDPAVQLRRSDIVKLIDKLIMEYMKEDMLLVEALDILKAYPLQSGDKPILMPRAPHAKTAPERDRDNTCRYISISTPDVIYKKPSEEMSKIYEALIPAKKPEGTSQKRNKWNIEPRLCSTKKTVANVTRNDIYEEILCPVTSKDNLPIASVTATVRLPRIPERPAAFRPSKGITRIEDIPREIDILGVEGMCQCLKVLKMDKVAKTCRDNLLDGKMLMSMDLSVLESAPISLNPLEIEQIKALKEGWRPKL